MDDFFSPPQAPTVSQMSHFAELSIVGGFSPTDLKNMNVKLDHFPKFPG